jgi:uncharacterized protein (UPF0332 family)
MNQQIEALVAKGKRSLIAAQRLFELGDYDFAASRAYYAIFYLAEALLLSRGMAFSKHSGVISAFGQHFIKTGLLPAELHAILRDAFDQRNVGDYDFDVLYPQEKALDLLSKARKFIDAVGSYLKKSND